jgi:ElaB/YqjD/DUF883 family membrane-anchored ribosome-binding protein
VFYGAGFFCHATVNGLVLRNLIMNKRNEQTVTHQAADVVDNVADGIRSAAHNVGASIQNSAHSVRDAAGRAVSAVEDTYDEVGHYAHDSFDRARSRVHSCENSLESCVRDNPKMSLLVAAGLGALLFAWWKR